MRLTELVEDAVLVLVLLGLVWIAAASLILVSMFSAFFQVVS